MKLWHNFRIGVVLLRRRSHRNRGEKTNRNNNRARSRAATCCLSATAEIKTTTVEIVDEPQARRARPPKVQSVQSRAWHYLASVALSFLTTFASETNTSIRGSV